MKTPYAILLLFASSLCAHAQTVLFTEDFETDGQGVRYNASQPFNDGTNDHWNRTDGSDISNISAPYTDLSGSFFWAAEDTDDNGGNGSKEQTLEITGIDITGQTDLQFQGLFGVGNENGPGASAYDAPDYIKVQAQIDGAGYVDVLWFSYLDGGDNFNEPLGVDRDFDGSADSASDLLGTALKSYSASIAGTGATLDIRILVYVDAGDEEIAFDKIEIVSDPSILTGPQPPTGLSAAAAAAPNNKDSLAVNFTPDGSNDVLLVYSTSDSFGTPADATSYSAGDSLPGGGTVAGVFSASPATVSGLAPGTVYFFQAFSVDGSTNYSLASATFSGTTDTFALQIDDFDNWLVEDVVNTSTWTRSGSTAVASGFAQGTPSGSPSEAWLISPEFDLDSMTDESFEFTYVSDFIDTITGLELFYTTAYTGDPASTSWIAFSAQNAEFTANAGNGSSVAAAVDLSALGGSSVRIAFKYTSTEDGIDTTRRWTLNDPLISGNKASDPAITLSATPAAVDEGGTLAVTLSLPANVGADTEFFLSGNGDGSELSFPASVTVPGGSDNVVFDVSGLSDDAIDGDQTVSLIANASGYTVATLEITVVDTDTLTPAGDILFTQYYEGASNDKWVEITNIGDSSIDLSGYQVATWSNANAEAWKTDGAGGNSPDYTLDLSGVILAAGQSYLIANSRAALPFSSSLADTSSTITFFGGNDSIVLYSDPAGYSTANIVDAIAFTSGNEGEDKGFVRSLASLGYDFVAGSSIENYDDDNAGPGVWTEITTATADAASFGDDAYLGTTALAPAPTSVFFTTAVQSVSEADGIIELEIAIINLTSGSVTVQVDFNAGNSTADLSDIVYPTPQQLTFDAASLVSPQTISIPIVDDGDDGGTEVASFDLSLVSGTAAVVAPSTQNVSIADDDFVIPAVFISEIVDPQDNWQQGRYVELYNASDSEVDLAAGNWTLVTYYNESTSGEDIPLTGTIPANGTYLIAEDAANFSTVYGLSEDQGGDVNSNGDDNFELRFGGGQSTGQLIDVYGNPGTDGTGEAWEFENGRAVRNADILTGNPVWTASEWTIEPTDVATGNMTPGIHPESNVPAPSGVSATAVSGSEVSIAFTPSGGNDVVVVFNSTGSFTAPSGTPLVGQPQAGGTVLYVGPGSSFAHIGLSAETQYFYALYSFDGSDYSNIVEVDATTPLSGLINEEDFESGSAQWTAQAIAGTSAPGWNNNLGGTAAVDGFADQASQEVHYLVSPALDFSSVTGAVSVSLNYEGSANIVDDGDTLTNYEDSLKLVYSTSYSGSGDPENPNTWTVVDFTFSNSNAGAPTGSLSDLAEISLPASLNGESTVYLALRYEAGGQLSNSEYWTVDNIVVAEATSASPLGNYLAARGLATGDLESDTNSNGLTVLEEYFFGIEDGIGSDRLRLGVDTANSTLTLLSDLQTDPDGVTVELLATSDLAASFTPVPFTVGSVDNGDGSFTRSYTETNSPTQAESRFYQLRLTAE